MSPTDAHDYRLDLRDDVILWKAPKPVKDSYRDSAKTTNQQENNKKKNDENISPVASRDLSPADWEMD